MCKARTSDIKNVGYQETQLPCGSRINLDNGERNTSSEIDHWVDHGMDHEIDHKIDHTAFLSIQSM